jgi:hypothetical protein
MLDPRYRMLARYRMLRALVSFNARWAAATQKRASKCQLTAFQSAGRANRRG